MPHPSSSAPAPREPHPLPRGLTADDDVRAALLVVHQSLLATLERLDGLLAAATPST